MNQFGIPKKHVYISLLLFAFNMFVAVHTYPHEKNYPFIQQLAYITFPFWGAALGGSLMGFVVLMFPPKQPLRPEVKYVRSKVVGILLVSALFFFGYIYKLIDFYFLVDGK